MPLTKAKTIRLALAKSWRPMSLLDFQRLAMSTYGRNVDRPYIAEILEREIAAGRMVRLGYNRYATPQVAKALPVDPPPKPKRVVKRHLTPGKLRNKPIDIFA